ncbi:hypothetical protein BC943DRAFT_218603 [Umbelopsis sp. AD052]|nr:hypothetical protein BC943DRAFT_218603 [Umbelopsis sp. AD052]
MPRFFEYQMNLFGQVTVNGRYQLNLSRCSVIQLELQRLNYLNKLPSHVQLHTVLDRNRRAVSVSCIFHFIAKSLIIARAYEDLPHFGCAFMLRYFIVGIIEFVLVQALFRIERAFLSDLPRG